MLVGVQIEHELPERAFQPRQAFFQHDETRARQFRRGFEIHLAERFAEFEMLLGWVRERIVALRAEFMMLHIAVLVVAVGHLVERQIGNPRQRFFKFLRGLLLLGLKGRYRCFQRRDLGHQGLRLRFVLGLFGLADFLGGRVAARLGLFERDDRRAPASVDAQPAAPRRRQAHAAPTPGRKPQDFRGST